MSQEKFLSHLKENAQECTLKQNIQEESVAKTTKKLTKVKEDNKSFNSTYILDDWDNWYPDSEMHV